MAEDFSKILFVKDLPELELLAARLAMQVEQDGVPEAAREIRAAYLDALAELRTLANEFAATATEALKAEERKTRVRPDTGGYGGKRLEDYLQADPVHGLPGTVGLANESLLYQEVPWWWTNEEGYSGHVGRVVHGHFYHPGYVGQSDPGAAASGTHPLFLAEGGPPMEIQNPIPERRFVLHTIEATEPAWHAGVAAIRTKLNNRWQAALNVARAEVLKSLGG